MYSRIWNLLQGMLGKGIMGHTWDESPQQITGKLEASLLFPKVEFRTNRFFLCSHGIKSIPKPLHPQLISDTFSKGT